MASDSQSWIRQAVRRSPLRGQRQIVALAILGVFMGVIIGALYLSNVADMSTTGRELEILLLERDRLQQRNEQLRVQISELRSVPRLLARAEELGFRQASPAEVEYLVVEGYNPQRARTVAPIQPDEETLPEYDETFGGWVRQQTDQLRRQFNQFNQLGD
jgi:cell division protein FtsL